MVTDIFPPPYPVAAVQQFELEISDEYCAHPETLLHIMYFYMKLILFYKF